jgi:acetylornithine deacetylase
MNPVELAAALIEFDSRNPSLVPDAPGEGRVAHFLGEILDRWGFDVQLVEVTPGRPNLIATAGRKTSPSSPTLMLNGHLDVVGTHGMDHPPFLPTITSGKLYGRGSADMKGGIAAMCVAAHEAVKVGIDGQVIIAAVIDEEYDSLGTKSLIQSGIKADAAIVTEPTRLAICPAHRGFVWAKATISGRAAHGSRYDIGIDAIMHAACFLAELDKLHQDSIATKTHQLLGKASLHASTIQGGTELSTYPSTCTVHLERRTLPGETQETFLEELSQAREAARQIYPELQADFTVIGAQNPSDVSPDTDIVRTLQHALTSTGLPAPIEGMTAWTDAALLNEAGIPAICFGPGDITLAHSATEYVPTEEIEQAARVLQQVILRWCNPA